MKYKKATRQQLIRKNNNRLLPKRKSQDLANRQVSAEKDRE